MATFNTKFLDEFHCCPENQIWLSQVTHHSNHVAILAFRYVCPSGGKKVEQKETCCFVDNVD